MSDPHVFLPNQRGTWNADTRVAGVFTDLSGNGRGLLATNVASGFTNASWRVTGEPVAVVAGNGHARSNVTAPWKPMHDGSQMSFWAVFHATGTGVMTIADTGIESTLHSGARIRIDNDRGRVGIEFVNGVGDGYVIDKVLGRWWSWNQTLTPGPHLMVVTFGTSGPPYLTPDIHFWIDSKLAGTLSIGDREKDSPAVESPLSTANPTFPLSMMNSVSGVEPATGEFAAWGVTSEIMCAETRAQLERWAEQRYGIQRLTSKRGILSWGDNSLVDVFYRPNPFPELVTTMLKQPTRNVMRAVAGLTCAQMISHAPKHIVPDYDQSAPFNMLIAWELVNSIAENVPPEIALAQFWEYCDARRAEGRTVGVVPMLPFILTQREKYEWTRVNFRAQWAQHADFIVPLDLDPILGSWDAMVADYNGPRIYRVDGTHFTDLSNTVIIPPYFAKAINSNMRGRILVRRSA